MNDGQSRDIGRREIERLLDLTIAGDQTASSRIVDKYKGKIAAVVYSILGPDDVEEVTHLSFVRVFNSITRFRRESSFYTYLVRITINLCRDRIRRRQTQLENSFSEFCDTGNEIESKILLAAKVESDPAGLYESEETVELIRAEMKMLTPKLRAAVSLRDIEGFDYPEIAKKLEVHVHTARARVFRAREKLRERLEARLQLSN